MGKVERKYKCEDCSSTFLHTEQLYRHQSYPFDACDRTRTRQTRRNNVWDIGMKKMKEVTFVNLSLT